MVWVTCDHSKKAVKRAGEALLTNDLSTEERGQQMEVLSSWRAAHAYPMHAMLMFLRQKSSTIYQNCIVVQRLKRTPSIVAKLSRFPKMKLHRMQDIGGCRSVVRSVDQVRALRDAIVESRSRHKLHREDDYISFPKESGYRGVHLIYKYNGAKKAFQDYFVEIQLRSHVQHSWATAVEIVEHFTRQALKASHGERDWLEFFSVVSAEFAMLELTPRGEQFTGVNTFARMMELESKLNAVKRLTAFAVSTQFVSERTVEKSDFFLLELHENAGRIRVTQYRKDEFPEATSNYLECEKQAKAAPDYDVVLVSADSLSGLKAAYPNYFADSRLFVKNFERAVQKARQRGA